MNCIQCGHQQEGGKFCGKCGSPLTISESSTVRDVNDTTPVENKAIATVEGVARERRTTQTATVQTNEQVERLKANSQRYWTYIKEYGLQPQKIFINPESQSTNSIITLILFLVLTPIVIASLIKKFYNSTLGGLQDGILGGFGPSTPDISIFPIFVGWVIPIFLLVGLSMGVSYVVMKISKQPMSFKKLISIYGTLLIPVVGIVILGCLFTLISQLGMGAGLIVLSVVLALYLYPPLILFHQSSGTPKIDSVHRALIYFAGYTIILYLTVTQYIKSLITPFIEMFTDFPF